MWIIDFFPNFVSHLIVTAGVIGVFLTSIPIIWGLIPSLKLFKLPVQIVSVFALLLGAYLEGGIVKDTMWENRVSILEKKLSDAGVKSAQVDTKVITKFLTKSQIIKEKGDTITEYIDREVVKYNDTCPIPSAAVKSHNAAAKNEPNLLEISTDLHNTLATQK